MICRNPLLPHLSIRLQWRFETSDVRHYDAHRHAMARALSPRQSAKELDGADVKTGPSQLAK
jgi:hypothetical protein